MKEATPLEHMNMSLALESLISAVECNGLPSNFGVPANITFSSADARAFTKLAKKLTDAIAPKVVK
jgi:class 3 adenylate cyclase